MAKSAKEKKAAPTEETPEAPSSRSKESNAALIRRLTATLADKESDTFVVTGSSKTVKLLGVVSTQCATLDAALGRGGVPFGRLTVITGGEGVGKTTLALHIVAEVQKMGGIAMYIDFENKLDIEYARRLGVNIDELVIGRPGYAEKGFGLQQGFIERVPVADDIPIVMVMDSINAAIPKSEFDGEDYEKGGGMGAHARVFSKATPKLIGTLAGRKVALIWISQVRQKLTNYGTFKERIAGGNAPKFYAAVAVELKKLHDGKVKEDGHESGHVIEAEVFKNQIAVPYKVAGYDVVWGKGIDYLKSLFDQAKDSGVFVETGGSWAQIPDPLPDSEGTPVRWQGLLGFKKLLAKRPELQIHFEALLKEKLNE